MHLFFLLSDPKYILKCILEKGKSFIAQHDSIKYFNSKDDLSFDEIKMEEIIIEYGDELERYNEDKYNFLKLHLQKLIEIV